MPQRAKPTHLKIVTGNPGKRPLNKREPRPKGDLFEPPEYLGEVERQIWTEAIADAPLGLLKRLDASVFEIWVVARALHREARAHVLRQGAIVRAPKTGVPIQNPYLAVVNRQALVMLKAAGELGFSPCARTRIELSPDDEPAQDERYTF